MKSKHTILLVFLTVMGGIFLFPLMTCTKSDDKKTSLETGTVTDIEGNVYKTVKIGTQWWMAENLKATKYRNGDSIPNIIDTTNWTNLTTGSYWWYENNIANKAMYGALYNWYAVNDSRNIAPIGWHVPTDAEWCQMMTYVDTIVHCAGEGFYGIDVGSKLKASSNYWCESHGGETNVTGFSALPGGYRWGTGLFFSMCYVGYWWTATESDSIAAWNLHMSHYFPEVVRVPTDKTAGYSIRCVKN